MKITNGRVVAITILAIFAIALILPLFSNVSSEEQRIWIEDVDMKLKSVNESHANIAFLVSIYRSNVVKNATLIAKIYDSRTNLLIREMEIRIPEKATAGMRELNLSVSLEKDRDYRIVFRILKDNRFVDYRILRLTGLNSLIPKYKELKMELKDVDFEVANVSNKKVEIRMRFYIEAMRDYGDILFHVKAVQYESNILASEKWINANISKGKTVLLESNLTIPKNYNYLIKLEAWRNESLLKTWCKALNLAPTKKIPENFTEKAVRFEVSEFTKPTKVYQAYTEKAVKKTPGFDFILAILSVGGAILWKRKRDSR